MTDIQKLIIEVLDKHPFATTAWGQTHCWCQRDTVSDGNGMECSEHRAHVAEAIVTELHLELTHGIVGGWTR